MKRNVFVFTSVCVAGFPVMLNDDKSITDVFVLSAAVYGEIEEHVPVLTQLFLFVPVE